MQIGNMVSVDILGHLRIGQWLKVGSYRHLSGRKADTERDKIKHWAEVYVERFGYVICPINELHEASEGTEFKSIFSKAS